MTAAASNVRRDKESAIDAQDFERAAHLRDQEKQLLGQKSEREKQWKSGDLDVVAEVDDELKKHFRPEFLNRIDDIVVFHQPTEEQIITMVDLMITRVEAALANKDMAIELTPAAKSLLARRGFDPVLGARPLRRTIQREIEDQLSEKILFGEIEGGQIVIVDVEGVNPDAPEGSRAADDKARFTFRGEPKPAVTVPDAPPIRPGW